MYINNTYMYIYIYVYIYTYTFMYYIYIYIHIYIYIYICIHTCSSSWSQDPESSEGDQNDTQVTSRFQETTSVAFGQLIHGRELNHFGCFCCCEHRDTQGLFFIHVISRFTTHTHTQARTWASYDWATTFLYEF